MSHSKTPNTEFKKAIFPIGFLILLILHGLILRPHILAQSPLPLEVIFILAATFASAQLLYIGYSWKEIQDSIVNKLSKGMPAFLILFAVGLIIGSWIICGTIPMLVYYGIKIINPDFIYFWAFVVPIVFSTLTGTSWGSVGTIGIVIIGIAQAIDAELCITAGAIVGGAYFGDKMSPLSDTTNMASIATEVPLYDHIRSMMYTTIPSAIIAAGIYLILGFVFSPGIATGSESAVDSALSQIEQLFNFHIALLIPPAIILYGSIKKKDTLPLLVISSLTACVIAVVIQRYNIGDIAQSLYKGYHHSMAVWVTDIPVNIQQLFDRGGLYALSEAVIVAICVFTFIGAIDLINAMPVVVGRIFKFAQRKSTLIISSLLASSFTNAMTSNQYATSFIVGDAFKDQYDKLKVHRKVLSRSLEDAGTMIESIIPWTPTAVFVTSTLGVVFVDYWHWQLLSLINLVVAYTFAITGFACFAATKAGTNKIDTDYEAKTET